MDCVVMRCRSKTFKFGLLRELHWWKFLTTVPFSKTLIDTAHENWGIILSSIQNYKIIITYPKSVDSTHISKEPKTLQTATPHFDQIVPRAFPSGVQDIEQIFPKWAPSSVQNNSRKISDKQLINSLAFNFTIYPTRSKNVSSYKKLLRFLWRKIGPSLNTNH